MIMPIKYTDEQVAEALAMRARGEKQAVVHLTFGAGIESAMRRVREREDGLPGSEGWRPLPLEKPRTDPARLH